VTDAVTLAACAACWRATPESDGYKLVHQHYSLPAREDKIAVLVQIPGFNG
jgi:hypothetical protein